MPTFRHHHRVRFRECDPMGVVYHTHCIDWFEEARTEALRSLGVAYLEIQDSGIDMPVIDLAVRYHRPVRYDDLVTVTTRLPDTPPSTRMRFEYEVHREGAASPAITGSVTLCFMDRSRGRPVAAPGRIAQAIRAAAESPGDPTTDMPSPTP